MDILEIVIPDFAPLLALANKVGMLLFGVFHSAPPVSFYYTTVEVKNIECIKNRVRCLLLAYHFISTVNCTPCQGHFMK